MTIFPKKIIFTLVILTVIVGFFIYKTNLIVIENLDKNSTLAAQTTAPAITPKKIPEQIKAVYVTAPVALIPSRINQLIELVKTTEVNAMVINVKDGDDVYLTDQMANLVKRLADENIYTIARIVVFQDNALAKHKPETALRDSSGGIWDGNGYKWVDPANKEVWNYNLNIALKAAEMGFDELNFDYFRFPSDGKISKIIYPSYNEKTPKEQIINSFADFLISEIKKARPNIIVSLDIFGYTFVTEKDLGIGQRLIDLTNYFDVISPMVYPSHYLKGNFGFKNPAEHPYEVVLESLKKGDEILNKSAKKPVIRPWLQDFDLGADYTPQMVRAQIKAVEDSNNKKGWMVWNPSVVYNPDNFLSE
ncbi:MAG: putative glycoside hydrolase [Patescibacteria group bacterium]|nr:putative glycoside hydrolase [Patescibacteria group bacterium]